MQIRHVQIAEWLARAQIQGYHRRSHSDSNFKWFFQEIQIYTSNTHENDVFFGQSYSTISNTVFIQIDAHAQIYAHPHHQRSLGTLEHALYGAVTAAVPMASME